MNSQQIACFLETARELNFTKAAENLTLPQPAVSRYITALEAELGVTLFVRENKRHIRLSENGVIYYNLFRRFALDLEDTKRRISPMKPLRFGYNNCWNIAPFLPDVVAGCRAAHPDFQISIECMGFHDLLTALLEHRLDAILTLENYPRHRSDIIIEHITDVRCIIIYSDLLISPERVAGPADLAPFDFFIAEDERIFQLRQEIESHFRPYHFVPKFKTVSNMETVIASVENGLGAAMLDLWGQSISSPDIHYAEMDSFHSICLAWDSKNHTESIRILKTGLRDYFSAHAK